jgi:hypothetical protein
MVIRGTVALSAALLLTGCGTELGRVTGCVTFRGEALPSGSVLFHAADGNVYSAPLAADGTFAVDGVPPGSARVTVQSHPRVPPALLGRDRTTAAGREAARFVRIPARYGQPDRSGLACQVRPGEQTCNFDLTP